MLSWSADTWYPVGPQSAWEDQWSTRWNPNVFAQQGYFVIAINPTGSTTFGQGIQSHCCIFVSCSLMFAISQSLPMQFLKIGVESLSLTCVRGGSMF